ncbi:hypothetical protein [Yinghuangia soli]|uniref:WD40 repeat domain-containing protein n=1 Tax=Yinghuangia soli TaxID=2908204 RepID=A0AA41Q1Y8_9ACTN|nr:hypothetical protein [Yinghuangia soli]MCF2529445.1 hypothetical protein [Yinghuangia soli]
MRFHVPPLLAAVAAALVLGCAAAVPAAAAGEESELLVMRDERITESSGLVASVQHPGVYWTHNDSGDEPRVFAVGADGKTKAVVTLQGVSPRDWEAVSLGKDEAGKPALFVADVGDNFKGKWPEVWIYRFAEPAELKDATVKPVKYRVTYDDGPRDAEAMLVDPRTNKIYLASKENDAGLYEQPAALSPTGLNVFRRIAKAPGTVTDGAFSPDGTRFVLRGYFTARMFSAPGVEVGDVPVPIQRQGESVAFSTDGRALLFGSEGPDSPVRRVVLDGANRPDSVAAADNQQAGGPQAAQPGAAPADGGGDPDGLAGQDDSNEAYGPGFLAVLGLVVLVYVVLKFRGRGSGSSAGS